MPKLVLKTVKLQYSGNTVAKYFNEIAIKLLTSCYEVNK